MTERFYQHAGRKIAPATPQVGSEGHRRTYVFGQNRPHVEAQLNTIREELGNQDVRTVVLSSAGEIFGDMWTTAGIPPEHQHPMYFNIWEGDPRTVIAAVEAAVDNVSQRVDGVVKPHEEILIQFMQRVQKNMK